MAYLLDTGILLRGFDANSADCRSIRKCLRLFRERGEQLVISVQNIAEFWNVATRPAANNGYGLMTDQVKLRVEFMERFCGVLTESLVSYRSWRQLLEKNQIRGVQVHDARLASVMLANRIENMLTLNERDFARFRSEGIKVFTPSSYLVS